MLEPNGVESSCLSLILVSGPIKPCGNQVLFIFLVVFPQDNETLCKI